jgi:hypothetical protein
MIIAEKLVQKGGQQELRYMQGLFCTASCKESDIQPAVGPIWWFKADMQRYYRYTFGRDNKKELPWNRFIEGGKRSKVLKSDVNG